MQATALLTKKCSIYDEWTFTKLLNLIIGLTEILTVYISPIVVLLQFALKLS